MAKRLLRIGFVALPFIASSMALLSACSDDDEITPLGPGDASADVQRIDGSNIVDGNRPDSNRADTFVPPSDSGRDTGISDGGSDADATITDGGGSDADATITDGGAGDADADADAQALTPLCVTYPDNVDLVDASTETPGYSRYELIGFRAVYSNPRGAVNACEIKAHFSATGDPPVQEDCLGRQLHLLAGCAGIGTTYEEEFDKQGNQCVTPGGPLVQLGFRDPQNGGYHEADIALLAEYIKDAAQSVGLSAADAERLKQLYLSEKSKALTADAGADAGPGGYSSSTCP